MTTLTPALSLKGEGGKYRGRFAPSPTGPLHFGSLVAAVASWLDARSVGGEWLVRIEDVDTTRTVPGAADEILHALEAHHLHWDGEVVRQSERTALYASALEELRAQDLVYRCRCSRKEISDSGLVGPEGAIYPGTCRTLALGRETPGAERLRTDHNPIGFADRVQGHIEQDLAHDIGDFVLERRDGLFAYQLAVVVDDAEQGITDVVRGADLLWSTPRQILLQRRLGLPQPCYLHIPVVVDEHGEKLSKQTRAAAIRPGDAAETLRRALAFLGQPVAVGEKPGASTPDRLLQAATAGWSPGHIHVSRR